MPKGVEPGAQKAWAPPLEVHSSSPPAPPHPHSWSPHSTADGDTAQTPLQNASQKPPIASWSAASLPPRTGSEQSGQLTRYKERTYDALPTGGIPKPCRRHH